jgi:hypothetical protein
VPDDTKEDAELARLRKGGAKELLLAARRVMRNSSDSDVKMLAHEVEDIIRRLAAENALK